MGLKEDMKTGCGLRGGPIEGPRPGGEPPDDDLSSKARRLINRVGRVV